MSKEEAIEVEGVVLETLPDTKFRIKLKSGMIITGYLAGKMRKHFIRIIPGDRVKVSLSPYDLTLGRINYREK